MGASHKGLGNLEEAIEVYKKAIFLNPDYADTYNNMGITLKEQGKLDEALTALNKALSIDPDNAEAYYNIGNALKEQGYLEEAIEAYTKALSVNPDLTIIHYSISSIKTYKADDKHFLQVQKLYKIKSLSDDDRCNLSFTLAKMYEDLRELDQAYNYLLLGNALRKKLLNYSINNDLNIFTKLKKAQPNLLKSSQAIEDYSSETIPIFILGMPRSGTTLVEQIISSHSEVTGGGELNHVQEFGFTLATEHTHFTTEALSKFRENTY